MNISAPFIARPIATALLAVAVLLAGYNGFFTPYLIEQNHPPQWAATVLPAG